MSRRTVVMNWSDYMKKFLLILCMVSFLSMTYVEAASTTSTGTTNKTATTTTSTKTVWTSTNGLERVKKVGTNLLSKNSLPAQINFKVIETEEINAFASGENELCVYTGLLNYVNDDNELAGVIAHEIGHILNNHVAKQSLASTVSSNVIAYANIDERVRTGMAIANNLSLLKMSRVQENEADVTGVDLMVKAGYNPLAMVSVLYKISGNYIDIMQTHPSGDKRTMYIYDYITYAYPSKLKVGYKSDSYTQFVAYATPIVNKRNASQSKINAFNKKQAKLQAKRQKKLAKYKEAQVNGWVASYNFLNALTTTSSGQ